jgi:hypothetical protein
VAGNNSLTGPMVLLATATIRVNAGQTLEIDADISGATFGVNKLLPGTLRYSGASPKLLHGAQPLWRKGCWSSTRAPANERSWQAVLTVGNDAGSQDADVVRLLQANQIP